MTQWDETFHKIIAKEDGYLRIKAVEDRGIYRFEAYNYLAEHNLKKVAKGVYVTKSADIDWPYIIQLRAKKAVISHESALYLHGVIEKPYQVSVTVPQGYNFARLQDKGVKIMTCKKNLLDYGLETVTTKAGHTVKTYNMHRTMIDILRKEKTLPPGILEIAEKVYYSSPEFCKTVLLEYGDQFRARARVMASLKRNGRM